MACTQWAALIGLQAACALSRMPNAPTIFATVSKLGLPSGDSALQKTSPCDAGFLRQLHHSARSSDLERLNLPDGNGFWYQANPRKTHHWSYSQDSVGSFGGMGIDFK